MMREYHVRICERLGVKFPGPTRHQETRRPRNLRGRFTSVTGPCCAGAAGLRAAVRWQGGRLLSALDCGIETLRQLKRVTSPAPVRTAVDRAFPGRPRSLEDIDGLRRFSGPLAVEPRHKVLQGLI